MNYILLMTSAGSLLFVGCLLLETVMGKRMSQTCRYWMLVTVLFVYLVPWSWLQGVYGPVKTLLKTEKTVVMGGRRIMSDAVLHTADELAVTPDYNAKMFIVSAWIAIAVLAMLFRCGVYFRTRYKLMKRAVSCEADVPEELVLCLKRELRIRRRVKIVRIPDDNRSFTLGAFRPVVFLQRNYGEGELAYILRHEFIHIARGDLLIKMLMQLVCCLHWFNPFVYFLNRRLDRVCEKACDERAAEPMSEDEREGYARLVVRSMKASGKPRKKKMLFGSFLASSDKFAEERIQVIMDKRKSKLWEKIVVAGVFAALLFADSLTALAYPRVDKVIEAPKKLMNETGISVHRADGSAEAISDDVHLYEKQVVTADGKIHPVQESPNMLCFHNWEDAEFEWHERTENGGCILDVYACKYCDWCSTTKVGELLVTHIYTTCPHDYYN